MSMVFAMAAYAAAMSASPGPVNLITLSSGLAHGIRGTLPFVIGATVGFTALLGAIGLGLSGLVEAYPAILWALRFAGTAFILFVAWKLFSASGAGAVATPQRPSFLEGAALQWLNPKAWLASISGVGAFAGAGDLKSLGLFCAIYFVVCFLGIVAWAILGRAGKRLVTNETGMRSFNRAMGALLLLVAGYLAIDLF